MPVTNYRNPPIKEAVIEIRVESRFDVGVLEQNVHCVPGGYGAPTSIVRHVHKLHFSPDQGEQREERKSEVEGFTLRNDELGYTVQLRTYGLVVSKQEPYGSWEAFKEHAKEVWFSLESLYGACEVERVAVRYINKICLPLENGVLRFEDYLVNDPQLPREMGSSISRFFNRVEFPIKGIGAFGIVSQASQEAEAGFLPVILDIDIFKVYSKGNLLPKSEVWSVLDSLRDEKNRAFIGSITDKTTELFS